jgi:Protein of unknown function (DUF1778)
MVSMARTTDPKGRVSLPKAFANATVIIEQISDTELRIRKAQIIPENEMRFYEGSTSPLSDRDRDLFLSLLDEPPAANEALRRAAAASKKSRRQSKKRRHG